MSTDIDTQVASNASRPEAPVRTESSQAVRPEITGPDTPEAPYPIFLEGATQVGFGRGGKELGCPTANLPEESLASLSSVLPTGVYYGYAQVLSKPDDESSLSTEDRAVFPMVMSLGWNPYYKNEKKSAEVHVLHEFKADFYDHHMKVAVLGYIRPELDYTTREALIEDIETDKRVGIRSLDRPAYQELAHNPFFTLS
ncbi:riboflavin kinase [Schizopora paradoxa]|uniref:Riboflavin kinase n=1 Tax=Schizopora paradoxa TaxID=27342 RepID=A0A0H2S7K5_9AGAM|nr:riboflavin kinase [Schizopora paradoxa]